MLAGPVAGLTEPVATHAPELEGDSGLTESLPDGFLLRRRMLEARLGEAIGPALSPSVPSRRALPADREALRAQRAALLDIAEFDLGHVLAPEGLSALDALPETLPADEALRRDRLALALHTVDSRDRPLPEAAAAILADPGGWADQPVYAALQHRRAGRDAEAARALRPALERLPTLPPRLRQSVLVGLLDVAVAARDWPSARALTRRIEPRTELSRSSGYLFLLGQAAQEGDDLLGAFDRWRTAGAGNDLWAHKARVALVEMGLETRTLLAAEARHLLGQEARMWSGDAHAIALYRRMAELDLEMGDRIAAIGDFATLIYRHPDSDAAALARQQARSLWTSFYEDGAAGSLSLTDYLSGHRRIAPDFRFEAGFDRMTEQLADRFLQAGATLVAANEYRETRSFLDASQELGLGEADHGHLDDLGLKEAEARLRGGQFDEVIEVLDEGLRTDDPARRARRAILRARAHSARGDHADVAAMPPPDASAEFLRLKGIAHFDRQEWAEARAAYGGLLDLLGADMRFDDAARLVLASHHLGDRAAVRALVDRFPGLPASAEWQTLARVLAREAPALLPLREAAVRDRVARAATTLEQVESLDPDALHGGPNASPEEDHTED